jgi:hypothetical protein
MDALSLLLGLDVVRSPSRAEPVIPEPEFKPFVFRRETPAPQVTAAAPATLQELGVPAALAGDLEAALRYVGATQGERVVGFTFRTPDGVNHALRQDVSSERAPRRAA